MPQNLVNRNGNPSRPGLYRQLSEQSDALDKLCREVSSPIRDARHYDRLEGEAQAIAKALITAFRGAGR